MKASQTSVSRRVRARSAGFTLIELLVVIAIIAILAGLLLPALASAKKKATGTVCINSTKQFNLGWQLYHGDFDGKLPYNIGGGNSGKDAANPSWVAGWLTAGSTTDNTNTDYLIGKTYEAFGNIGASYIREVKNYRCPTDKSRDPVYGPRVRSFSMNSRVGWNQTFKRAEDLGLSRAGGNLIIFIEERDQSINDGWFVFGMAGDVPDDTTQYAFVDVPGSYHNGGGAVSFADYHVEIRKWNGDTQKANLGSACPGNSDHRWMMDHGR